MREPVGKSSVKTALFSSFLVQRFILSKCQKKLLHFHGWSVVIVDKPCDGWDLGHWTQEIPEFGVIMSVSTNFEMAIINLSELL